MPQRSLVQIQLPPPILDSKPIKDWRHLLSVWLVHSEYGASPLLSSIFGCVGKLETPADCKSAAESNCWCKSNHTHQLSLSPNVRGMALGAFFKAMMMKIENLNLYRGDTYSFDIEVTGDDDSPLDLTGSQVAMTVAPKGGHAPFSPDISVNGNVITVIFHPHHTQGATWRNASYDVQITQGEAVTTIVRGDIEMRLDITP